MKKSQVIKNEIPKNPFAVEDIRTRLALNRDFINFKKTYTSKYPEIKANNSNRFWNEKFKTPIRFRELDGMTKEKIDTVIKFIPKEHSKILDLGIGQAYLEQRLRSLDLNYKLFGIDISEKSIKRAKRNFIGEFMVGNVMDVDRIYRRNYFDSIIALELIEHISPKNIFSLLRKIKNLLKRKGILVISTPINEGLRFKKDNPSGHVRDYTSTTLIAELELSGFKIIETQFLYAFEKYYGVKKLLSKIFKNRWGANNVVVRAVKV